MIEKGWQMVIICQPFFVVSRAVFEPLEVGSSAK